MNKNDRLDDLLNIKMMSEVLVNIRSSKENKTAEYIYRSCYTQAFGIMLTMLENYQFHLKEKDFQSF